MYKYTFHDCVFLTKSYAGRSDLSNHNRRLYNYIKERNWLDDIFPKYKRKYTFQIIVDVAHSCSDVKEFRTKYKSAYVAAIENNWLKDVYAIVPLPKKFASRRIYSDKAILLESLKYTTMKDFRENCTGMWRSAKSRKHIWELICDRMFAINRTKHIKAIIDVARQCSSYSEFYKNHQTQYLKARDLNIIDSIKSFYETN